MCIPHVNEEDRISIQCAFAKANNTIYNIYIIHCRRGIPRYVQRAGCSDVNSSTFFTLSVVATAPILPSVMHFTNHNKNSQ